ncbi:phosphotransferase [Pimelobacter simplex]|uniref:phosphotransferase family protein n=1 Tax=Nocardioides simplex TaxID=2045 RepID=UPI000535E820|nr:phosphotransferase family protein [Pimelobacter simplex]MCG8154102.1 phosphotransferase [Pimelobacter simplex]GEB15509.1 acyl-CoA dehydrogenase [Pimelobacter simplex]SFM58834.1 Predicted kinase, aminoglycoside phosphotransferase (APT) family [Pimelobacter simplex]
MNPPGLDLDRLGAWLSAEVLGAGAQLSAELVAGGKSNLTFVVSDGSQEWIVRRPPLGHVLATAHDMGREYRVMSALQDTDVPVPRTFAFCSDPEVVGADFYVMERCAGVPYRRASELEPLGSERVRGISERLVDTLLALHAVDPAAVGLTDFGRPEGFLGRQVGRWRKQLDASYTRDLPAADELHRRLAASVPDEAPTGIVHGDYRLDNVLVDSTDGIDRATAVLDWEMATLGDPLTDLALMLTYHQLATEIGEAVADASEAPGFLGEDEVVARYAAGSDRDLSRFGWYRGLAAFKLAAILEGIHYRFLAGQTVGEGFAGIGDAIHPLLDAGLAALKEND